MRHSLNLLSIFAFIFPVPSLAPSLNSVNDSTMDLNKTQILLVLSNRQIIQKEKITNILYLLCKKHKISPSLILAIIQTESDYKTDARSKVGAIGLMQLKPTTANETAKKFRLPYSNSSDLNNPEINLRIGVTYLSSLRKKFSTTDHYLMAYNIGPSAMKRHLRIGSMPSLNYVHKVYRAKKDLRKLELAKD